MPTASLQKKTLASLRKLMFQRYNAAATASGQTNTQAQKQGALAAINNMSKEDLIARLQPKAQTQTQTRTQTQTQTRTQTQTQGQRQSQKSKKPLTAKQKIAQKIAAQRQASKKRQDAIRLKAKEARATKKSLKATKPLRSRAGKIMRAMKSPDSKVVVKQGKMSPQDFTNLKSSRDKYTAFVKLYSDVRFTSKKRRSKKSRKSVKKIYEQIEGQKLPYMIKKSKKVPTRVVAIPGQDAIPFNQLSLAEQQRAVAFLNNEGKKLREKGAPRKVKFQDVKRQSKKTQTQTKPQGGSNYYR